MHRLLNALQSSDLIAAANAGRGGVFVIGSRMRRILASDTSWIVSYSKRWLKSLADETGETCFVARLFGTSIRSVVMESPSASVGVYVTPGYALPPHASATGKVLTAMQDQPQRDAILQAELQRLTDKTILDRAALEAEYTRIRQQGFASEFGEHAQGLSSIACPILLSDGEPPIYALGLTGPSERVNRAAMEGFLPRLQAVAAEVSRGFAL